MSDNDTTPDTDPRTDDDDAPTDDGDSRPAATGEDGSETGDDGGGIRVRRYANYAILLVLGLLAFVAVIRLYLSVSDVIATWITHEYRSLFQAAFNLIVLLVTGVAISYQLKRLYG